jgi:hypothetical protein
LLILYNKERCRQIYMSKNRFVLLIRIRNQIRNLLLKRASLIHSSCFREKAVLLKLRETGSFGMSSLCLGETLPLTLFLWEPLLFDAWFWFGSTLPGWDGGKISCSILFNLFEY